MDGRTGAGATMERMDRTGVDRPGRVRTRARRSGARARGPRRGVAAVVVAVALASGAVAGWSVTGPSGGGGPGPTSVGRAGATTSAPPSTDEVPRARSSAAARSRADTADDTADDTAADATSARLDVPLSVTGEDAPAVSLPAGLSAADVHAGLLGHEVPESGDGDLVVVPGERAQPADAPPGATVLRVRVEVERGLAVDGVRFAAFVLDTLDDPRGWGADGSVTFARTDGDADLRVVLASPDLVDALCAPLRTGGEVSCGRAGHAVLNLRRWVETVGYDVDATAYRQYLVNHEVGHLLGHAHERCSGAGRVASVMQQQSYAVAPCTPNAWPFP